MSSINPKVYTNTVSKVTLSPLKSNSGDALLVTIKKVESPVPEDIPKTNPFHFEEMNKSKQRSRKTQNSSSSERRKQKSKMDESKDSASPSTSAADNRPSGKMTFCTRHAAQRLSRKKSDVKSDKLSLCNSCSKSMLSYIFLVQDFLDSLAGEISGNAQSRQCMECVRETLSIDIPGSNEMDYPCKKNIQSTDTLKSTRHFTLDSSAGSDKSDFGSVSGQRSPRDNSSPTAFQRVHSQAESFKKSSVPDRQMAQDRQKIMHVQEDELRTHVPQSEQLTHVPQNEQTTHAPQGGQSMNSPQDMQSNYNPPNTQVVQVPQFGSEIRNNPNAPGNKETVHEHSKNVSDELTNVPGSRNNATDSQTETLCSSFEKETYSTNFSHPNLIQFIDGDKQMQSSSNTELIYSQCEKSGPSNVSESASSKLIHSSTDPSCVVGPDHILRPSMERQQPSFERTFEGHHVIGGHSEESRLENINPPLLDVTSGSSEVADIARREMFARLESEGASVSREMVMSEAFVTIARNNAEAFGCLVLGTSLRLCGTSRSLCVLISDSVNAAFRSRFASVFHVIQNVRSLDSLGTTKLGLLQQPELGISLEKLNVWRLKQFSKCVYLNPDTLVIQNCDELFDYDELSAVPDVGWPDCFNSGMFVFTPSEHTFWKLLEFAETKGSYDGGDQGILNSYFNTWSHDIHRKLSFIYNLVANVNYTYTPAFKHFGRNVKIVQFMGSYKPWHVKFFSSSGAVSPASAVHPTFAQFVSLWLDIFRIKILSALSEEVQTYASTKNVINVVELLRFFPTDSESEVEFVLSPPSVRLRLEEKHEQSSRSFFKPDQMNPQTTTDSTETKRKRRQSAEFLHAQTSPQPRQRKKSADSSTFSFVNAGETESLAPEEIVAEPSKALQASAIETSDLASQTASVKENTPTQNKNLLPGSEIGDYQGMKVWEQGRMDYQGSDSSENIIKRLEFLMLQNR